MKLAFFLALGVALGVMTLPAHAQLSAGGMGGAGGGPKVQPQEQAPDIAPSGLPGLGGAAQAPVTGPQLQHPASGDPTQNLFAAINSNDYTAAQEAVSHGADLNATNQFAETPLDLSIALSRNDITFMLLGTRNELMSQGGYGVMGAPLTLDQSAPAPASMRHIIPTGKPTKMVPLIKRLPDNLGTPNLQAGFLGFGSKP